jgi:hypothetical protein
MATIGAATPPSPPAAGAPLQVVLFGLPAAGKTSLLGALGQAAQSQEHLLHGRLSDPSHGLGELQRRLYGDKPRRTSDEIIPYPVHFEPFGSSPDGAADDQLDAVFIDCDGQVANDLLARRKELSDSSPEGTLAREVLDADTLILVIDASAPPAQVDADFIEFGRFLHQFEQQRGRQIEVGGLPVFLVLAKCDLLAHPEDTPSVWIERIEESKRQVAKRFHDFIAHGHAADEARAFGHIDLHLWATAVKRPALVGVPAKPNEPYGVAELFRQCLVIAALYRRRCRRSSRRLAWTLAGTGGLFVLLLGMIVALAIGHGLSRSSGGLQSRIDTYQLSEGRTVAERLRGSPADLGVKIAAWAEFRNDPAYDNLPVETRGLIRERLEELKAYTTYLESLKAMPAFAPGGDRADLEAQVDALKTSLALPRPEWGATEAAKLHADRLEEAQALLKAIVQLEDWYQSRTQAAEKLWLFSDRLPGKDGAGLNWPAWQGKANDLLTQAATSPVREADAVPGAPTFTYATILRVPSVAKARENWEHARLRLERLRDISAALGLGGPVPERPTVLVIPKSPTFTLDQAGDKLKQLEKAYPRYAEQFTLEGLPDAVAGELRQAARTNYDLILEPAREEVLRQLQRAGKDTTETRARWNGVLKWLEDPKELASWRELARVMVRLIDPKRTEADPVKDLAAFLKRDAFDLDLRQLTLEIPDRLDMLPTDDLTLYLEVPGDDKAKKYRFEIKKNKERDAQRGVTQYLLEAANQQVIVYHVGDTFWAALPLREVDKRDQEWSLTWARGHSELYQFERLIRPPRLRPKDQPANEGKIVEDVRIIVTEGSLPPIPDLMPVVKLDRR